LSSARDRRGASAPKGLRVPCGWFAKRREWSGAEPRIARSPARRDGDAPISL
jgi:hypothetical protein